MSAIPEGKDQWYVVHVLSGQERKVRDQILRRIKSEEMEDLIYKVLMPTEKVARGQGWQKDGDHQKILPRIPHRQHAPPR